VTVVGITGHRALLDEPRVVAALTDLLKKVEPPLVGVSAVAAGADQLFARAVLALGGSLEIIVPGADYRDTLPEPVRAEFDRLVDEAAVVTTLDIARVDGAAYLAAGLEMLDRCDVLIAVWDGQPSRGAGGTADMVRRARERGIRVEVVDAERSV
jgi:hypothetical protein